MGLALRNLAFLLLSAASSAVAFERWQQETRFPHLLLFVPGALGAMALPIGHRLVITRIRHPFVSWLVTGLVAMFPLAYFFACAEVMFDGPISARTMLGLVGAQSREAFLGAARVVVPAIAWASVLRLPNLWAKEPLTWRKWAIAGGAVIALVCIAQGLIWNDLRPMHFAGGGYVLARGAWERDPASGRRMHYWFYGEDALVRTDFDLNGDGAIDCVEYHLSNGIRDGYATRLDSRGDWKQEPVVPGCWHDLMSTRFVPESQSPDWLF